MNKEKIVEYLGVLYDLADKIYKENLNDIKSDTSSDAAEMTAILNGINKEIPFLSLTTE